MQDRYQRLFAEYATRAFSLPQDTIHEVKRRMLDTFGVMCAAIHDDAPQVARSYAEMFPLGSGATLFGSPVKTAPEFAAFANGVHARYLDFNDTYLSREPLHPSDCIPALLALAEWNDRSGAALAEAIAISYEISMDLCDAASLRAHGWDHTNYIGIGVAAGASRLLRLTPEQTAHAISIAIVPHAAMRQTRVGELSMWKGAAAPNSARNGLFGALLAARGMTGPFEPITGEMGMLAQMLGGASATGTSGLDDGALASIARGDAPHRICDAYIKAYPLEYHAQSAVDAASELHGRVPDWQQIEQIEIETFRAAYEIIAAHPEKWNPTTRETADHSLQYITAVALLDGQVTKESFSPERLVDDRIKRLLGRTKLSESARLTALYPEGIPNRITVRSTNGETHTVEARYPRGHAGNKMNDEEVIAKFTRNSAGVLSQAAANELLDAVWKLESLASLKEITTRLPESP